MEDIEDIERFYEQEIEKTDKEFSEKLKQTKNRRQEELKYKENLKKIQSIYIEKYRKYLDLQKKRLKEKKIPKPKKEPTKTLKVEKIDFEKIGKKEKKKQNKELKKFKRKIKRKKVYSKLTPKFLFIFYLNTKFKLKNSLHVLNSIAKGTFSKIKIKTISAGKKIKETFRKIRLKIGKLFEVLSKKFSRKKGEKKAKTEEEALLEKVLNK